MFKLSSLGKIANGYHHSFNYGYTISRNTNKSQHKNVLNEIKGLLIPIHNEQYIIAKKYSFNNTSIPISELTEVKFNTESKLHITVNNQIYKIIKGDFTLLDEYLFYIDGKSVVLCEPINILYNIVDYE